MVRTTTLRLIVAAAALVSLTQGAARLPAPPTQVTFDLPDTIECRDATPPAFAASHPTMKVIEAKLRISARVLEGSESEIVDFLYIITSPDKRMRFQDYLPNTTLESTVADDRIEVTAATEDSTGAGADARVEYKIFSLGGAVSQNSKKSESNRYKQIAPKALVLASGTTDREHGIFFKLRPSNAASLEGAKEFTFLATVPRAWRGDWCTVSCAARTRQKAFFNTSIVPAGVEQTQVGLYLVGDLQAASLAGELRRVQEGNSVELHRHIAKDRESLMETMYDAASTHRSISDYAASALCGIFKGKKCQPGVPPEKRVDPSEAAQQAVVNVQDQLRHLSE